MHQLQNQVQGRRPPATPGRRRLARWARPFTPPSLTPNIAANGGCSTSASGRTAAWRSAVGPLLATLAGPAPVVQAPTVPQHLANKPRLTFCGPTYAGDGMSADKPAWGERLEGAGLLLAPPSISKSDDHFAKMGLEFVEVREGILLSELNDLFEKVGFPRRDPDKLRLALEHTYALTWVRATKPSRLARSGQLIGFARATSDGALSATIWDVAVNPAWQRAGLGRAMMERLTRRLVEDGIPTIALYAEPHVVGLYERLGFMKDPDGIRGMAFQRRKQAQAGGLQGGGGQARRPVLSR